MVPSLDDVELVVGGLLGSYCLPWHVVRVGGRRRLGFCVVMDDVGEYVCAFDSEEPWDDFWAATRVVWSARRLSGPVVQLLLFEDRVDLWRLGLV